MRKLFLLLFLTLTLLHAPNDCFAQQATQAQKDYNLKQIETYNKIVSMYFQMILHSTFADNATYVQANTVFTKDVQSMLNFSQTNNSNLKEAIALDKFLKQAINLNDIRNALKTPSNPKPDPKLLSEKYFELNTTWLISSLKGI